MTDKRHSRSSWSHPQATHARAAAAAAMLLSGCAAIGLTGPQTFGVTDPPGLSPYNRSIQEPVPAAEDSLGAPTTIEPRATGRPPVDDGTLLPEEGMTDGLLDPSDEVPLYGPQLLPPTFDDDLPETDPESSSESDSGTESPRGSASAAPAAAVTLNVTAPEKKAVDQAAVFTVLIAGGTSLTATGIAIEADFDDALTFPGHAEKRVRQPLGMLTAGGSREITLALTGTRAGRHCCRFTVVDGNGRELAARSACVEFTAAQP